MGQANIIWYIHLAGTVSKRIDALYTILEKLEEEKSINSHLMPINAQTTYSL